MFTLPQWRKIIYLFHLERNKDRPPQIIERKNHSISRSSISPNALRILHRLNKFGYKAYLVGGSVRDMLLGCHPKDFDIVTDAHPQEIRKLFRNSRLIGRRFRLVHIHFSNEIIEVSTFRANTQKLLKKNLLRKTQKYEERLLPESNIYGTIEEDAWQRDFTINALYYNIVDLSIIDFTGGVQDLQRQLIRMIGDPTQRYYEDPVRLLRAIRLSAKLHFKIHTDTEWSLGRLHNLLRRIPSARLFTEVLKIFFEGHAVHSYQLLHRTKYMRTLFLEVAFNSEKNKPLYENLIKFALKATDERYNSNKSLNPAFLFAIFLWPIVQESMQQYFKKINVYFQRCITVLISHCKSKW